MMSQSDIPAIEDLIAAPINRLFVEILTTIFHIYLLKDSFRRFYVNDYNVAHGGLGRYARRGEISSITRHFCGPIYRSATTEL